MTETRVGGRDAPSTSPNPTGTPPHLVAAIGASAGGLDALSALLSRVSAVGIAIVIIQHHAAGREKSLSEVLSRMTDLSVEVIRDGLPLARDRVYVAPPDRDIAINEGVFHVIAPKQPLVPRRSIDSFFRSLAEDVGRRAVGIILSGSGSDGTVGLQAIKEEGGLTFVQLPASAASPQMPESALAGLAADFCLPPAEIGDELVRLSRHPYVSREPLSESLDATGLSELLGRLRHAHAIDFTGYKPGTIERRVQRRMALHKLDTVAPYLELVESNPEELASLYQDLLIGVTSFFRDPEVFDVLRRDVFPRLLAARPAGVPVRVWVAGCSTGEEAYSIAMCMLESIEDQGIKNRPIQIFATDVDQRALLAAREGLYPRSIEADVSPERLRRFFHLEQDGYRISRLVRDAVVFAIHDLTRDPPFSRIDLVSCRNVLIYMRMPFQLRLLSMFHYALNPRGVLLLGPSESTGDGSELFAPMDRKHKIFTKQEHALRSVFDFGTARDPRSSSEDSARIGAREVSSLGHLADRKTLDRYAPPGLLVDGDLHVLQFRGDVGPFLAPISGAATLDAGKLIRPELVPALRRTLDEARQTRAMVRSPRIVSSPTADPRVLHIEVMRLTGDAARECFLVLFCEEQAAPESKHPEEDRENTDPRVVSLELELASTRDTLQLTIEDLQSANEELQSANEELQSGNEELQSTNEELETSKEELQATNEELTATNDELQTRMVQLGETSDDLTNVMGTVSTAVLIVDRDLRIRAFSSSAERLLNLGPEDVGRPVAYIRTVMMVSDLESIIGSVIKEMAPHNQRARSTDGFWYAMRIRPYLTSGKTIRGALVEFERLPPDAVARPGDLGALAHRVLASIPQALALLDGQGRISWANRPFLERLSSDEDVFGRTLRSLWSGPQLEPELWTLIEDAIAGGRAFSNILVPHPLVGPEGGHVMCSARPMPAEGDRPAHTLLVLDPVPPTFVEPEVP